MSGARRKLIRIGAIALAAFVALWIVRDRYLSAANESPVTGPKYATDDASIQVGFDQIILVRGDGRCGAFMIDRWISKWGYFNGVRYEYWYWSTNCGDAAAAPEIVQGHGMVYEALGSDRRGSLNIEVGDLWVMWSDGNHVYPQATRWSEDGTIVDPPVENIEIAATTWGLLSEIDFNDTTLRWIGGRR